MIIGGTARLEIISFFFATSNVLIEFSSVLFFLTKFQVHIRLVKSFDIFHFIFLKLGKNCFLQNGLYVTEDPMNVNEKRFVRHKPCGQCLLQKL